MNIFLSFCLGVVCGGLGFWLILELLWRAEKNHLQRQSKVVPWPEPTTTPDEFKQARDAAQLLHQAAKKP